MAKHPCSCGTGVDYRDCCAPYHRGEREAEDPLTLMRSRYAAFAEKKVDYLWRTLHAKHDDRTRPEAQVMAEFRQMCGQLRYMGLEILGAEPADANGVARVMFLAKLFERGANRSFVECSEFRREGDAWRYVRGDGVAGEEIDEARGLSIEAFIARFGEA